MIKLNSFDYAIGVLIVFVITAAVVARAFLRPRPLVVDVAKAKMAQAARGYDPDARVYPHPWVGKQVRMLYGHPELGLNVGDVGLVRDAFVGDDTELYVKFDQNIELVMLEHENGRYFEVLP